MALNVCAMSAVHHSCKHGLSQAPNVISDMGDGDRVGCSQARDRVIDMLRWPYDQRVLSLRAEAVALLEAAGKSRIASGLSQGRGPAHPRSERWCCVRSVTRCDQGRRRTNVGYLWQRLPPLLAGRADDVRAIEQRLNIQQPGVVHALTIVRGWSGVAKTTLAAMLAHDSEIVQQFPDRVLWASSGSVSGQYLFNNDT